jgi:hypothetical protein
MPIHPSLRRSYAAIALVGFPVLLALVIAGADDVRTLDLDEITVQRINVVEPDGTLKMVISNSALMHPGVIDGDTLMPGRSRPPGILFFDDQGDEMGGVAIAGDDASRFGGLLFDQINNDETLRLVSQQAFRDNQFVHQAGLSITDRNPAYTLPEVMAMMQDVEAIEDPAERQARIEELSARGPLRADRMFVGRRMDGEVSVDLRDNAGRSRLRMVVESDGAARIEFLDEEGAVVRTLSGDS